MESPAVSGTQHYKLCLAAKREERRLNELKKKQQYLIKTERPQTTYQPIKQFIAYRRGFRKPEDKSAKESLRAQQKQKQLRCYVCDSPGHLACRCWRAKTESTGEKSAQAKTSKLSGPMIRDNSCGNLRRESHSVVVNIEGIPITRVIDTGSDITILRGDVFYSIVSRSDLNVLDLKIAEQVNVCTYDQKPICLDGQMYVRCFLKQKCSLLFGQRTFFSINSNQQ